MSNLSYQDQSRIYSQLVGRVWADADYAERLKTNPRQALAEIGLEMTNTETIVVKINDASNVYLALDAAPRSSAAQMEIEANAAFSCFGTVGTAGTAGTVGGTLGSAACIGTAGSWNPF